MSRALWALILISGVILAQGLSRTGGKTCTSPSQCSGQGVCIQGVCVCRQGNTCSDCSKVCAGTWPDNCVTDCPQDATPSNSPSPSRAQFRAIGGAPCETNRDCSNFQGQCSNGQCDCFFGRTCEDCSGSCAGAWPESCSALFEGEVCPEAGAGSATPTSTPIQNFARTGGFSCNDVEQCGTGICVRNCICLTGATCPDCSETCIGEWPSQCTNGCGTTPSSSPSTPFDPNVSPTPSSSRAPIARSGGIACNSAEDCLNQGVCSLGFCVCNSGRTCVDCAQNCNGIWPASCQNLCPEDVPSTSPSPSFVSEPSPSPSQMSLTPSPSRQVVNVLRGGKTCVTCSECGTCEQGSCVNNVCECSEGWTCAGCTWDISRGNPICPATTPTPSGGSKDSDNTVTIILSVILCVVLVGFALGILWYRSRDRSKNTRTVATTRAVVHPVSPTTKKEHLRDHSTGETKLVNTKEPPAEPKTQHPNNSKTTHVTQDPEIATHGPPDTRMRHDSVPKHRGRSDREQDGKRRDRMARMETGYSTWWASMKERAWKGEVPTATGRRGETAERKPREYQPQQARAVPQPRSHLHAEPTPQVHRERSRDRHARDHHTERWERDGREIDMEEGRPRGGRPTGARDERERERDRSRDKAKGRDKSKDKSRDKDRHRGREEHHRHERRREGKKGHDKDRHYH